MLYLYSAAMDWAKWREDAALARLMRRKWTNIIGRKFYLTSGLGHSRHGEGFAQDDDLPNDLAYCETCTAIALTDLRRFRRLKVVNDCKSGEGLQESALHRRL
jgi:DUF1680 family protein